MKNHSGNNTSIVSRVGGDHDDDCHEIFDADFHNQ